MAENSQEQNSDEENNQFVTVIPIETQVEETITDEYYIFEDIFLTFEEKRKIMFMLKLSNENYILTDYNFDIWEALHRGILSTLESLNSEDEIISLNDIPIHMCRRVCVAKLFSLTGSDVKLTVKRKFPLQPPVPPRKKREEIPLKNIQSETLQDQFDSTPNTSSESSSDGEIKLIESNIDDLDCFKLEPEDCTNNESAIQIYISPTSSDLIPLPDTFADNVIVDDIVAVPSNSPKHSSVENNSSSSFTDETAHISSLPRLIDFVPKDNRADICHPKPITVDFNYNRRFIDYIDTVIHPPPNVTLCCPTAPVPYDDEILKKKNPPVNLPPIIINSKTKNQSKCTKQKQTDFIIETETRLPPDGREFSVIHNNFDNKSSAFTDNQKLDKNGAEMSNQNLPEKPKTTEPKMTKSYINRVVDNDERCLKSIKDKIEMFSKGISNIIPAQKKSESTVLKKSHVGIVSNFKKNYSVYNSMSDINQSSSKSVKDSQELNRTKSTLDLSFPEKNKTKNSMTPLEKKNETENKDKHITPFNLHSRSVSLMDVGSSSLMNIKTENILKHSSLVTAFEQRKKRLSKLKGLMIPEKSNTFIKPDCTIDLPEIKNLNSVPAVSISRELSTKLPTTNDSKVEVTVEKQPSLISPISWKGEEIQKYSPAFKRKTFSLQGISSISSSLSSSREELRSFFNTSTKTSSNGDSMDNKSITTSLLQSDERSIESISRSNSVNSSDDLHTYSLHGDNTTVPPKQYHDSDNDSAVSSSRSSSLYQSISPSTSPVYIKQDSMVEPTQKSDSKRILKSSSIEAAYRKNVLLNSKYRSGEITNTKCAVNDILTINKEENKCEKNKICSPEKQIHDLKTDDSPDIGSDNYTKTYKHLLNERKEITNKPFSSSNRNETDIKSKTFTKETHKTDKGKLETETNVKLENKKRITTENLPEIKTNDITHQLADILVSPTRTTANRYAAIHNRENSIEFSLSDDSLAPTSSCYGSANDLQRDQQFGSITSLASSTSLISQQELSQLIEESNHGLEDGTCSEVNVIILYREMACSSVGIILAGGVDYESKEVTVHKVLAGSPADRDGRIQKGDRILSINGKSMKGLTHLESLTILKAPRAEVVLVVSRQHTEQDMQKISLHQKNQEKIIPEKKVLSKKWSLPATVTIQKDNTGLGFSIEGGKESSDGDQPITIKKIFTGGNAEKSAVIFAGDEILKVNTVDLTGYYRFEAWALLKKLRNGFVNLTIRHPIYEEIKN